MSKRHEDLCYLTALGHNAIQTRRGLRVDTRMELDLFEVDSIEVGVDMYAVRAALGEKGVAAWFDHYDDAEVFTCGIPVARKALLLGELYESGKPHGWADCLACDGGCERCNDLGAVPSDMLTHCPICDGDGSTPLGGTCKHCTGGTIWECDRSEIITEAQMDEDYDATERSLMGEI